MFSALPLPPSVADTHAYILCIPISVEYGITQERVCRAKMKEKKNTEKKNGFAEFLFDSTVFADHGRKKWVGYCDFTGNLWPTVNTGKTFMSKVLWLQQLLYSSICTYTVSAVYNIVSRIQLMPKSN